MTIHPPSADRSGRPSLGASLRPWLKRLALALIGMGLVGPASADTLLTWDVNSASQTTGTVGSSVASPSVAGVSGSVLSAGSGTGTGNTTSPANTWNRNWPSTNSPSTLTNGAPFPYTDAGGSMGANLFISWTTTVSEGYTMTVTNFIGLFLAKTSVFSQI